jgi:hypothetical protein
MGGDGVRAYKRAQGAPKHFSHPFPPKNLTHEEDDKTQPKSCDPMCNYGSAYQLNSHFFLLTTHVLIRKIVILFNMDMIYSNLILYIPTGRL